jgi:hypothetical protein
VSHTQPRLRASLNLNPSNTCSSPSFIFTLRAPTLHPFPPRHNYYPSNLDIWTETVRASQPGVPVTSLSRLLVFRLSHTSFNIALHCMQYGLGFYFNYLSRWPDMCCVAQHPSGRLMGYGTFPFFSTPCSETDPTSSSVKRFRFRFPPPQF